MQGASGHRLRSLLHRESIGYGHLLVVLVAIGLVARLWHADSMALWIDEAISARAAQGILLRGTPSVSRFGEGLYLYGRSPLHSYLVAVSYAVFGVSTLSARIPGIVFGTLAIPAVYLFGAYAVNKRVGLYAAAFATLHPWMIATSRYTRFYAEFQTLFLLVFVAYLGWLNADRTGSTRPLSLEQVARNKHPHVLNRTTYGLLLVGLLVAAYLTHRFYVLIVGLILAYAAFDVVAEGRIKHTLTTRAVYGVILLPVLLVAALVAGLVPPAVLELASPSSFTDVDASWIVAYLRTHDPTLLYAAVLGIVLLTARIGLSAARPHAELLIFCFAGTFLALSFAVPAVVGTPRPRYFSPLIPLLLLGAAIAVDEVVQALLRVFHLPTIINLVSPRSFNVPAVVAVLIATVILVGSVSAAAPHFADDGYEAEFSYGSRVQSHDLRGPSEYVLDHASGEVTVYIYPLNSPTFYLDWERGGVSTIRVLTSPENTGGGRWADEEYAVGDLDELKQRVRADAERGEVWFVVKNWYNRPDRADWVRMQSTRVDGPWKNAEVYKFRGDEVAVLAPSLAGWEEAVVSVEGNVFGTSKNLALGRTRAASPTWGSQSDAHRGELVLRTENQWESAVLTTRVYGADQDRYVTLYYSSDGETWTKAIDHDEGGWQTYEIRLEEIQASDDTIYLRVVGGASEHTSTGGLVSYLRFGPADLDDPDG